MIKLKEAKKTIKKEYGAKKLYLKLQKIN